VVADTGARFQLKCVLTACKGSCSVSPPLTRREPVSVTRHAARPAKESRTFANSAGTAIAPLRGHTVNLDCKT
jgi:hypothetical protein